MGKSVALGLGSGFREWSLPVVGGGKRGKGKREEVGKEKVRIREERDDGEYDHDVYSVRRLETGDTTE